MRILAGIHKGKSINVPRGIRPVSLRLRKACFDILGREVSNKRILDLFAGSGSLGLEALSRGANRVVFVDDNKRSLMSVGKNIQMLREAHRSSLCFKDAFMAVRDFYRERQQFDFIFLDPPYYHSILTKALQALEEYDIVARFGYIVGFCYKKDDYCKMSKVFSLIVCREYGQSLLVIYRK